MEVEDFLRHKQIEQRQIIRRRMEFQRKEKLKKYLGVFTIVMVVTSAFFTLLSFGEIGKPITSNAGIGFGCLAGCGLLILKHLE